MRLYELTEHYSELQNLIDEGEEQEILIETLEAIDAAIEEKVESIYRLLRNLESDIGALKTEEKRLLVKRKALEKRQEWLKNYVDRQLTVAEIDKVNTPIGTVAYRKVPASVEIVDASLIPEKYLTPQEPKVDKRAILKDHKDTNVSGLGFRIIKDKRTLQFR